LVYDNYNALVIGFGPNERPSDAIFSIAFHPRRAGLFFLQGARLADPHKRFSGNGTMARHVIPDDVSVLDDPQVRELMDEALRRAKSAALVALEANRINSCGPARFLKKECRTEFLTMEGFANARQNPRMITIRLLSPRSGR
jgi:hypothetical protein